ncbi:MAG: hypothetical protein AVDCRST_MAG77-3884 [uncultured Chloroflexi bacterium]|uniref:Arc-like DNA binding domain-containing protein n=1 Tax=uncultured Chloroflexota bacterium TaxID=166587 RepID=A0A6J4JLB1_9CHLR|nr:MAG: hypothetical protein AVDCRST_MAG77-3884 [uncultured Chloroflexota bacterium]
MRVTLRLPDELHHRLEARSRAVDASLNQTIVSMLHETLARLDGRTEAGMEGRAAQLQRVRTALGELVVELDEAELLPELRPGARPQDTDALRTSMLCLDPPLSATIIADREDRV